MPCLFSSHCNVPLRLKERAKPLGINIFSGIVLPIIILIASSQHDQNYQYRTILLTSTKFSPPICFQRFFLVYYPHNASFLKTLVLLLFPYSLIVIQFEGAKLQNAPLHCRQWVLPRLFEIIYQLTMVWLYWNQYQFACFFVGLWTNI